MILNFFYENLVWFVSNTEHSKSCTHLQTFQRRGRKSNTDSQETTENVRWLFSLLKYRIETAKQTSNPQWASWDWTEIIKWIITTLTDWWYCKDCISWNWNTKEWNLEIFVWACQQLRAYIGVFNYNHRLRQNKNISDKHTFTLIVYQNWKKNRLQKATLKHAVRDLPNRKQIFF